MSKIVIRRIEALYKNSSKLRILSDIHGNILWSSKENVNIAFPDGIGSDISDGMLTTITADGKICCAEGSVIEYTDNKYLLWTADSMTEILMKFGHTDTYTDTSFMLACAKSNINDILKYSDNIMNSKSKEMRDEAAKQELRCYDMLRQIESLSGLFAVINQKATKAYTLNVNEEIASVIKECNRLLSDLSVVINAEFSAGTETAYISGGKHLLYVMLLSVIKKAIDCSDREYFSVIVKCDSKNVYITVPFVIQEDYYSSVISDDFEIYCSSLYAKYLGGELEQSAENDTGMIKITLPLNSGGSLNSPRQLYNNESCEKTAKIFISGVKRRKETE